MNFDRLEGILVLAVVFGLVLSLPSQAADVEAGRTVYTTYCAVCHGADGRPDADSDVVKALGVTA